jgi:cell fate (sporulation/competence/biofilm development) regulator YlbF (YheA/YmcA/DUF963 family)
VKRANDALNNDRDAMAILRQIERLRADAQQLIERGDQPTDQMEQQLNELLGSVQTNPAYQQFIVAQENFDKTMLRVNQWILDGIKKGAASPIITLG